MSDPSAMPPRGDAIREALVAAALKLFGEKGFEGASTREIAAAARTKTAMIAYYFGDKEGLRAACAEVVAARIVELCEPFQANPIDTPEKAYGAVIDFARLLLQEIVADDAPRPFAQFLMREIVNPSAAFERLYESMLDPLFQRGFELWARATGGDPASVSLRLNHAAMLGQLLYFRLARKHLMKRMGWREFGPAELRAIEVVVIANLEAVLSAGKRAT